MAADLGRTVFNLMQGLHEKGSSCHVEILVQSCHLYHKMALNLSVTSIAFCKVHVLFSKQFKRAKFSSWFSELVLRPWDNYVNF